MKNLFFFILLIHLLSLSACGSNNDTSSVPEVSNPDPDSSGNNIPSSDTTAIAGFWDSSFIQESNGAKNIRYFQITEDARWITYDYRGDEATAESMGASENCYDKDEVTVFSVGDDKYQVGNNRTDEDIAAGEQAEIIVTLIKQSNTLSANAEIDSIDLNQNNSVTDVLDDTWELVVGIDPEMELCQAAN